MFQKKLLVVFLISLLVASNTLAYFDNLTGEERKIVISALKNNLKYNKLISGNYNISVLSITKVGQKGNRARFRVSYVLLIEQDRIHQVMNLDIKIKYTNEITWYDIAIPVSAFLLGILIAK